jgi:hypothetical protein
MATVYPEACNLCAAVTYTRSPTRSRNCCLERAGGGVAMGARSLCTPVPHTTLVHLVCLQTLLVLVQALINLLST